MANTTTHTDSLSLAHWNHCVMDIKCIFELAVTGASVSVQKDLHTPFAQRLEKLRAFNAEWCPETPLTPDKLWFLATAHNAEKFDADLAAAQSGPFVRAQTPQARERVTENVLADTRNAIRFATEWVSDPNNRMRLINIANIFVPEEQLISFIGSLLMENNFPSEEQLADAVNEKLASLGLDKPPAPSL